jgi:hypothetical protein
MWLLFVAMVTGGLTYVLGPIALLYVTATLFVSCTIVWLLQ